MRRYSVVSTLIPPQTDTRTMMQHTKCLNLNLRILQDTRRSIVRDDVFTVNLRMQDKAKPLLRGGEGGGGGGGGGWGLSGAY